ncbi:MAG: glutathione S-transferase family protein [Acidobacteriota bacterium]|jgi:glutathione S-transferase
MIRLYGFPYSTNMERVLLALGHKDLEAEFVAIPYDDRSQVIEVSGQDRVPVIDHDGTIVHDSPVIIEYLEEQFPELPLFPPGHGRRAEMKVFIDWFNRVWKVPPNAIEAELGKDRPDQQKIAAWQQEMRNFLPLFENMLAGRDYLMGEEMSAADCIAWPFLRYALIPPDEEDTYLFHAILVANMPLGDDHGRLRDWIRRVAEKPMTPEIT